MNVVAGKAWNRCICDERYCPVQGKLLQPPPALASRLSPPPEFTPAPLAQLFFSEPLGELICDVQFKWGQSVAEAGRVGAGLAVSLLLLRSREFPLQVEVVSVTSGRSLQQLGLCGQAKIQEMHHSVGFHFRG